MDAALGCSLAELGRLALSDQTTRALRRAWGRFGRFAAAAGVETVDGVTPETVRAFVLARQRGGAPPSVSAMHWRRSAVRLLFRIGRQHGWTDGDPTLDLVLPRRSSLRTRQLTDDEVALCRWASLATAGETRLPAVWALAEAGATTGEIPAVCTRDIVTATATVCLPGTTKTDARAAQLTDWGATQLSRRLELLAREPATPLVYDGRASPESAQASVSGAVGDILRRAGLGDEPDVRPRSVTAWAGRRVFDQTGRIEAVAKALGMRSLDRAAVLIAWDWRS